VVHGSSYRRELPGDLRLIEIQDWWLGLGRKKASCGQDSVFHALGTILATKQCCPLAIPRIGDP
jgi:hypothetical protein